MSTHQIRLIKRLFFLLIPYTLLRVGFYFYHIKIYREFSTDEIVMSFLLGIRFDIAAILLVNAVPILLSLLKTFNHKFLSFERGLFIFLNTIAFIVAVDDYELFLYIGKRLSFDFFLIADDIFEQLPQIILHYWYLPLIGILFGVGFYFFDKRFFTLKNNKTSWFSYVTGFLLLGLAFIGIRGGLQHKSINVQTAFIQGKNELGHLVLNTPYHFLRTLKNRPIKSLAYFSNDDEAKNVILNQRQFRQGIQGHSKTNIVLIILESVSNEYMEAGYTPFLNELKKEALFFSRHLANGRRSVEALPSILCGLPSLMAEPLSKSIFQGNKFNCFPSILKDAGYTNYFFHAGSRGTMGFESYTLANGFHRYFSREDYGNKDYDGTWGVFDLPYLQYVADEIGKMPTPFVAGIFTLSSHQPYRIPDEFKGKFPKGTLEIHESIGYVDYALKQFFEKIKSAPWFYNTLFIITSDHSQKLETPKYMNMVGRYRVPLFVYGPGINRGESVRVTQHADIPASILDYVEVSGDLPATSVSIFNNDPGVGMNYADGSTYFLAENGRVHTLDQVFPYNWETGESGAPAEDPSILLKAYLQYFLNGLINNNLSL